MQITFTCSNCQTALEVAASDSGKGVECPSCKVATTVPRQEPGPGTTIGGFYIKSLIGVGGSGNVFLATQLSMDRDVALKVLSAAVTKDPEDLERFMNEVRTTARLEHPNIISAYEAGEDDGYYYMAMAYINGLPLDQKIKYSENGYLPEKKALGVTKKMALALSYAWTEHDMLHRDVKPENILLDTKGEPKLADLGLSRTSQQTKKVTSHGTIMGTPNYMSPEQIDELSKADLRSDIYSLGASLYQMLTGKIPFESDSTLGTFKLIATTSLINPRRYNKKISSSCIKLLEKMLARNPKDRYQTWKDVLTDLTQALHGRQIATPKLPAGKSALSSASIAFAEKRPSKSVRSKPGKASRIKPTAVKKKKVALVNSVTEEKTHTPIKIISPVKAASMPNQTAPRIKTTPVARSRTSPKMSSVKTEAAHSNGAKKWIIFASLVILIVVVCILTKMSAGQKAESIRRQRLRAVESHQASITEDQARLAERYNSLMKYVADNADNYGGCVVKLKRALRSNLADSIYADRIREKLDRIVTDRAAGVELVWNTLKQHSQELYDAGQVDEALHMLRSYAGKYAIDIKEKRYMYADSLEKKSEAQIRNSNAEKKKANGILDEAMKFISDALITMDLTLVSTLISQVDASGFPSQQAVSWREVSKNATDAVNSRWVVSSSFRSDKGKNVVVSLKNGNSQELRVTRISGNTVYASSSRRINGDYKKYKFSINDISELEYLKRLGSKKSSGLDIIRGIITFAESPEKAQKYFSSANCKLGNMVAAKIK